MRMETSDEGEGGARENGDEGAAGSLGFQADYRAGSILGSSRRRSEEDGLDAGAVVVSRGL